MKQNKFTKSARGEDCTLQMWPHCNGNTETTVLCHLPSEFKGVALKSPDWWAVFGCSSCHDILDGRAKSSLSEYEVLQCAMWALYRTHKRMIEKGLIQI